MRIAISIAAPPRHLRWQTDFIIKAYPTLSPLVSLAFVSMTIGFAAELLLGRSSAIPQKGKLRCVTSAASLTLHTPTLVASNGGGYAFKKELHPSHRHGSHLSSLQVRLDGAQ
jgi:hypothetical protein